MALFMRINGEEYELEPGSTNSQRLTETLITGLTGQTEQTSFRWSVRQGEGRTDLYVRPQAIVTFAVWETPDGKGSVVW